MDKEGISSGRIPATLNSFELPAEILDEICSYLPAKDMISFIQHNPIVRYYSRSFNFYHFDCEQLIYLYQWNNGAVKLGSPGSKGRLGTPDIRDSAVRILGIKLPRFAECKKFPIPLGYLNIHCHVGPGIPQMFQGRKLLHDDDVIRFTQIFFQNHAAVKSFGRKIDRIWSNTHAFKSYANLRDKCHPGEPVLWTSLHLFRKAMEYIQMEDPQMLSKDTIYSRYFEYHGSLIKTFGKTASILLSVFAGPFGIIFAFREMVAAMKNYSKNPNFYSQYRALSGGISEEVYATYLLSQGFDRTLRFIQEEPSELEFLKTQPKHLILAWENFWEDCFDCLPILHNPAASLIMVPKKDDSDNIPYASLKSREGFTETTRSARARGLISASTRGNLLGSSEESRKQNKVSVIEHGADSKTSNNMSSLIYVRQKLDGEIGHTKTWEIVLEAELTTIWNRFQLWLEAVSPLPLVWAPFSDPVRKHETGGKLKLARCKCSCGRSFVGLNPQTLIEAAPEVERKVRQKDNHNFTMMISVVVAQVALASICLTMSFSMLTTVILRIMEGPRFKPEELESLRLLFVTSGDEINLVPYFTALCLVLVIITGLREMMENTGMPRSQILVSDEISRGTQEVLERRNKQWGYETGETLGSIQKAMSGITEIRKTGWFKTILSIFNPQPQSPPANPRNVLLCCRRFVDKQAIYGPIDVLNGHDQRFFSSIRKTYKTLRGSTAWFSLREVANFKFKKFEPFHTIHVSCSEADQLPTQGHHEYEIDYPSGYSPNEIPFTPPISSDILLFFYHNPGCADLAEKYLKYIPKRIVNKPDPPNEAWGLYIEEGLSVYKFWIIFRVTLIASFIFIIVWLNLHPGDLQGATAPPMLVFGIIATLLVAPEFVGYHKKMKAS